MSCLQGDDVHEGSSLEQGFAWFTQFTFLEAIGGQYRHAFAVQGGCLGVGQDVHDVLVVSLVQPVIPGATPRSGRGASGASVVGMCSGTGLIRGRLGASLGRSTGTGRRSGLVVAIPFPRQIPSQYRARLPMSAGIPHLPHANALAFGVGVIAQCGEGNTRQAPSSTRARHGRSLGVLNCDEQRRTCIHGPLRRVVPQCEGGDVERLDLLDRYS
jgi:hypothetical protein